MSNFLSGLRSALTRATSYGSATSAQSPHEASEVKDLSADVGSQEKTREKDPFFDEDSFINLEASQVEIPEEVKSSDDSQTASTRTLSFDDESGLDKRHLEAGPPATPLQATSVGTPKTIFQTAQRDIFKTAFKSAAKERDIFMTAKPIRSWNPLSTAEEYEASPTAADSVDDSSVTLSLDQASHGTPSVSSKRDREEDEEEDVDASYIYVKHPALTSSPKRRRTSQSPEAEEQALAITRHTRDEEEPKSSYRHISELDTSGLSDDENSGFSSSDSWSLDGPPPGLDRKARRNWKRQQRRAKSSAMEQISGIKKAKSNKKSVSRSGFKKSVSGRDILIKHARRRFWDGRVGKDVFCY